MNRTKDAYRHQSNNRVIMWYKIRELYSKGFNKTQIAFQLGLHRSTVRRYLKMDEDTLTAKLQHRRQYPRILDKYESYVCDILSRYRFLSASQIHDWMKEQYPDLPVVFGKTVYNFVETVRRKYNLNKEGLSKRVYEKMPDNPLRGICPDGFRRKPHAHIQGRLCQSLFFCHGDEPFQTEVRVFFLYAFHISPSRICP